MSLEGDAASTPPLAARPPAQPRLARAAGVISAATSLSRLLGLVREQVFAALLGASPLTDAFVVAFRIPNLLRDLFAEGALSAAFVRSCRGSRPASAPPSSA
jgi:putative peptidoglycan lipid II flippase